MGRRNLTTVSAAGFTEARQQLEETDCSARAEAKGGQD